MNMEFKSIQFLPTLFCIDLDSVFGGFVSGRISVGSLAIGGKMLKARDVYLYRLFIE